MITLKTQQLTIAIHHKPLIENISLSFQSREVWGIIGPNGVGKTTLLHTLAGLIPPFAGTIYLNHMPLPRIPLKHLAKKRGLLLQEMDFLFPYSVLETTLLGRYPHQKHILCDSPLDVAQAKTALSKLQLESLAYRSVAELSGGEKRRTAIAVLLSQNPLIYLLDEPTNYLDIHYQMQILKLFVDLAKTQNKIIIMVLHNLQLAQLFCEKIILLEPGKPPLWGRTKEVIPTHHDKVMYAYSH